MSMSQLNLKSGKWLVANCGKYPSEKNCQLVLMAPESKRAELINAVVDHAVKHHGHTDSEEFRQQMSGFLETIDV